VNHPVADSTVSHAAHPTAPSSAQSGAASGAPHRQASGGRPLTTAHHRTHHDHAGLLPALQSLMSIIVIAIFIITFCVQPFRIPSESMESTLLVGDFLLVNKQNTAPDGSGGLLPAAAIHRGDVIVFHDPVNSGLHLVKRVIGLPGDHLRLHDRHVYINGKPLVEPYAIYRPSPPDNFRDNFPRLQSADPDINSVWWIKMRRLIDNGELIIPADSYFVLGDNRNDSEDSRYWGFVPRNEIVGKPLLIYFSLAQRGAEDPGTLNRPQAEDANNNPARRLNAVLDFARWSRTLQVVH
jgi:signal peptidase I